MYNVKRTLIALTLLISILLPSQAIFAQQEEKYFFEFTYLVPEGTINRKAAEMLPPELAKIGIKMNLDFRAGSEVIERYFKVELYEDGGWDALNMGWGGQAAEPTIPPALFHTDGGFNWQGYKNGISDKLIDLAKTEPDRELRKGYWQEWQEEVYDDQAFIWLWWSGGGYFARKEVEGFRLNQVSTHDAWNWAISGKTEDDYVTLTMARTNDATDLNPVIAMESGSYAAINPVFSTLISAEMREGSLVFVPELATSWEVSEDGLTWTFNLRDDVEWHDGVPFTSKDVKFTYDSIMTESIGAKIYGDMVDAVESVENPNDYTVVIKLKQFTATFLDMIASLAAEGACIVPEHILGDVEPAFDAWKAHDFNRNPIGTGPMKFVEWLPDEHLILEAWDDWWGGRIFVDRYVFAVIPDPTAQVIALEKGEIDAMESMHATEIQRIEDNPDLKIVDQPMLGLRCFIVNFNHPILSNKYVRWAISHVINRQKAIDEVYGGRGAPARGHIPPFNYYYNPDLPDIDYNIEKAKEYMEMAGFNYEWLEPPPEPPSPYPLMAGGIVGGLAVGVIIAWVLFGRRT